MKNEWLIGLVDLLVGPTIGISLRCALDRVRPLGDLAPTGVCDPNRRQHLHPIGKLEDHLVDLIDHRRDAIIPRRDVVKALIDGD